MKIHLILLFAGFSYMGFAANPCEKADQLFEQMAYYEAIIQYEICVDKMATAEVYEKLAASYQHTGHYSEAADWYAKASLLPGFSLEGKREYGIVLLQLNNQEEAEFWLDEFLEKKPRDQRAINAKNSLNLVREMAGSFYPYEVSPAFFNSETADYSPVFKGEEIIFSSERGSSRRTNPATGGAFSKLYVAELSNQSVRELEGPFDSKYNDGAASFNRAGDMVFFTRNRTRRLQNETATLMLMYSELKNGKWTKPKEFPHNSRESNFVHPSLSPDGRTLVFASDRAGSSGDYDLYSSEYNPNRGWIVPRSLGRKINTKGHEAFPVFMDDTTLVFSSNGHPGLGGMDLFKIVRNGRKWSDPVHLPPPLNSSRDDYSLTSMDHMKSGYLTSNRSGRDQIYFFEDTTTVELPPLVLLISAKDRLSNKTLRGANITLENEAEPILNFTFEDATIKTTVEREGTVSIKGSWKNYPLQQLILKEEILAEADTIESVLWLDFPEFILEGRAVDAHSGLPLDSVIIRLRNSDTFSDQRYLTQNTGTFSFLLAPDSDFELSGQKEHMFASPVNISTKGLSRSETMFVTLELRFEEVEVERTFTLENIYYDYDNWVIRPDAARQLDILIDFMQSNPDVTIELSSHTDSRGDKDYNMLLSQRRAESAVNYLIENGIDNDRLEAKGYGESRILNHCHENVDCTEEEHQENRRTEIRILSK